MNEISKSSVYFYARDDFLKKISLVLYRNIGGNLYEQKHEIISEILRDKTIDDKLKYITNDDEQITLFID